MLSLALYLQKNQRQDKKKKKTDNWLYNCGINAFSSIRKQSGPIDNKNCGDKLNNPNFTDGNHLNCFSVNVGQNVSTC